MEGILYELPVFEKFSPAERIEALKYFRASLQESGAIPTNDFDKEVITIRQRIKTTAGQKWTASNERLVQDLCSVLNKQKA